MSHLPFLGEHWTPLLNYDPVRGVYFNTAGSKSPASSPQRCNCSCSTENMEEVFEVQINLPEYTAQEIKVRQLNIRNVPYLIVEAKKKEVNGVVECECIRRVHIPEGLTLDDFSIKYSRSNGVLFLTATKMVPLDSRQDILDTSTRPPGPVKVTETITYNY